MRPLKNLVQQLASPLLTRLLTHQAHRVASDESHEWLEDVILVTHDRVSAAVESTSPVIDVTNSKRFRVGDLVQVEWTQEVFLVDAVIGSYLKVSRGSISTLAADIPSGTKLNILGNKNGDGEVSYTRFTERVRRTNQVQTFGRVLTDTADDDVLKSYLSIGLRELEQSVICGVGGNKRITGITPQITTNRFEVSGTLDEAKLNLALRKIWERSSGRVDTVVMRPQLWYNCKTGGADTYVSDFGMCKVFVSDSVPEGVVLILDSNQITVLPLVDYEFQLTDDNVVLGKYTLEMRDENSHGMICGLEVGE